MKIQPIVEGHGEVEAVPVLLRRLRDAAECWNVDIDKPIRWPRNHLIKEDSLKKAIELALYRDCGGILVLFDSDQDCPKDLAPRLAKWAKNHARDVPCEVVMAHKEYEAWFLASIESLRGKRDIRTDAEPHPDPELPRGAKAQLEQRMERGTSYMERIDQPALTQLFDMSLAYRRCRSFRKLTKAFADLVGAMGLPVSAWPPREWALGQDAE